MAQSQKTNSTIIQAITEGEVKELTTLQDEVFAKKMMGDGLVIAFPEGTKKATIVAPVDGELVTVFPTKHAYGIKTKNNIEILIHIGLDTVNLNGKGFKALVTQGQNVKAGDPLAIVKVKALQSKVPAIDPIIIVTSGQKISKKASGKIKPGQDLFKV